VYFHAECEGSAGEKLCLFVWYVVIFRFAVIVVILFSSMVHQSDVNTVNRLYLYACIVLLVINHCLILLRNSYISLLAENLFNSHRFLIRFLSSDLNISFHILVIIVALEVTSVMKL